MKDKIIKPDHKIIIDIIPERSQVCLTWVAAMVNFYIIW